MPGYRDDYEAEKRQLPVQIRRERLRIWTGWERLSGHCTNGPSKELKTLPREELARLENLYVAKTCRPAYVGGELGELLAFESSAAQASRLTSIGDRPLLIITKDTASPAQLRMAKDGIEREAWSREQESLTSLARASWLVVARGSGHAVHHDRPDLLLTEMTRLVEFLRGGPVPPFGSKTTEWKSIDDALRTPAPGGRITGVSG